MEDEKVFANVLPDATLLLWSKLLERRGYSNQITDGEVILSPSKADIPPHRMPRNLACLVDQLLVLLREAASNSRDS